MGFKNWQTPIDFFMQLNNEFDFTLDAAASHANALCGAYCTESGYFHRSPPNAPFHPRLSTWYRKTEEDGLIRSWQGERVFCNPPYDSSLYQWVEKAARREAEVAVLLLPPSIDTAWFHDFIYNKTAYRFLRGRLKFWRDGKVGPQPRAGTMVAIFRKDS